MTGILVIAELRRGELRDVTLELIGAAQCLRAAADTPLPVSVAVIDRRPSRHLRELALSGVDEVLQVPVPVEHFEANLTAQVVTKLTEELEPVVVIVGHTADGMGFGAACAARGGYGFASDVIGLQWDGGVVATRGAYGNKLEVELDFPGKRTTILMVRPGSFTAAAPGSDPPVRQVEFDLPDPVVEHHGFEETTADDVDITKAPFLLSVGRGIGEQKNVDRFSRLAEQIGATLSVSRPLVDAGWVSSARQVGQSGRTVAPKVYIALGISGAVQHLAGIKGVETVIAVNSDPEAPIFGVADYGAVADLFEVADHLAEALAV